MITEIEQVLASLNAAGARYLIAGGIAVALHGVVRTTADLDLMIDLERENLLRALNALKELGYVPRPPVSPESFADPETRKALVLEKGMQVFSLWSRQFPLLEVDIFVSMPFDFDAVYARAARVRLQSIECTVLPLDELIREKERVGRHRDLADVEQLRRLRDGR